MQADYDADTRRHREAAKKYTCYTVELLVVLFVVGFFLRLLYIPYCDAHARYTKLAEQAEVTLQTNGCSDPVFRAKLEGYNMCEQARIDSTRGVRVAALVYTLGNLPVCEQGLCLAFKKNISDVIWRLFWLLILIVVCVLVHVINNCISARYSSTIGAYQLPMMAQKEYVQFMHQQQQPQQQQQSLAPPPRAEHCGKDD